MDDSPAETTRSHPGNAAEGMFDRFLSRSTVGPAMLGGLLLWAAFPPIGFSWLAWVAPAVWVLLVRLERPAGRRPYRALWLAGFVHWLVLMQGIRLAHWATHFGWILLAFYLAFYLPLFVGLARVAVHRLGVPVVLAAPLVWVGLEYARAYVLTGFSMALLGHTQVDRVEMIQSADLCGGYTVSFLVMFVAACLGRALPVKDRQADWRPMLLAATSLAAALAYGQWRIGSAREAETAAVRVALIQGSVDTSFDIDPDRPARTHREYRRLTRQAVRETPDVALAVWPESMFSCSLPTIEPPVRLPAEADWTIEQFEDWYARQLDVLGQTAEMAVTHIADDDSKVTVPLLVGTDTIRFGPYDPQRLNSAVLIDGSAQFVDRYDKMHPVMFGEYVPLGDWFPWLYRLVPMHDGLTAGTEFAAFEVAGLRMAPSICFENTVPHLIRRQMVELDRRGQRPDVLVTLTNDGWFWGSSVLDLHLACGVFRAVENRTATLIAANTGFSAWIDGNGRVRAKGPRRDRGFVIADVRPDPRRSAYHTLGDWPAGACLAFCGVCAVLGCRRTFYVPSTKAA